VTVCGEQKAESSKNAEKTYEEKLMDRAPSPMHSALCLLGAMIFALSISAHAQQPKKTPRIGILSPGSSDPLGLSRRGTDAFQQGLHKLGWVDGKNIVFEYRWANENDDRLPVLAAELLLINVDVILVATPRAANAAKKLTKTIPIVADGNSRCW